MSQDNDPGSQLEPAAAAPFESWWNSQSPVMCNLASKSACKRGWDAAIRTAPADARLSGLLVELCNAVDDFSVALVKRGVLIPSELAEAVNNALAALECEQTEAAQKDQRGWTPSVLNGQVESPSVSNLPPLQQVARPETARPRFTRISLEDRHIANGDEFADDEFAGAAWISYTAVGVDANAATCAESVVGLTDIDEVLSHIHDEMLDPRNRLQGAASRLRRIRAMLAAPCADGPSEEEVMSAKRQSSYQEKCRCDGCVSARVVLRWHAKKGGE